MTRPAQTPSEAVLQVESLQVERLGQPVVRGVNLTVTAGEVTVLLGANGVGKSTLLDGISGVIPTSGGRVVMDGVDMTRSSRRHRAGNGLAYVQQGRTVFPGLTVEENFLVAAKRPNIHRAFELFPELRPRATVKAASLSGGEQQMVVLGRSVLQRPRVLMIDELSLGLAPVVVERMFESVARMAAEGLGVLLVEQFADRALSLGRQASVLARGVFVLQGAAEDIRLQPERLQAAYLGETETAPADPIASFDETKEDP